MNNKNILTMDKNFKSNDDKKKRDTKRKCFMTIIDCKETKQSGSQIKSTFFFKNNSKS